MGSFTDLTGKTFGEWSVIEKDKPNIASCAMWICKCSCGACRSVSSVSLVSGKSKSCGCKRYEFSSKKLVKHGHNTSKGRTPTYETWRAMLRRCKDRKHKNWGIYGGNGIKVCERWKDFSNFLSDMGERPEGKSLDRIDSNKDYCLENCKWSTPMEQANNMKTNHYLTFNNETHTIAEWARALGKNVNTLRGRLHRGWTVERTLST